MAIEMECLSVVVPKSVIELRYPGGLSQYRDDCPNQTFLEDEHLTRIGFMAPSDVKNFTDHLIALGLVFLDERMRSVELVVVDMMGGPTTDCKWLKFKNDERGSRCWLRGTRPGKLSKPERAPDEKPKFLFTPN